MNRKNIMITLLSLFYSICIIIGNSFMNTNSFLFIKKHIFINILLFISIFIILFLLLKFLFTKLDNYKEKKQKNNKKINKYIELFDKHPFLISLIIILILWSPYIIAYYPVILSKDPSFQIKQFFNIPNKYSTYVVLLDPNMIITNHHPVFHTLLLGSCLKLGVLINNHNLGLFIYSMIQIGILSSTLAYTISYFKKLEFNRIYLLIMLLFYGLVPIFPYYSMSCVKDVIFASFVILYIIHLYKFIKEDITKDLIFKMILIMIGMILFRNNGIHTIILSFPFLFFLKKNWKKYLIVLLFVLGFNFTYNKIVLPYFKVTPTSIREALSIPFQQTARYVRDYPNEVTNKEKEVIDKILTYDTLAERYNPEKSDPVKNEYNRYATSSDLKEYFKTWFSMFLKHPITYVEATINNTYGYFYPLKVNWYLYTEYEDIIVEDGFNYHFNSLKGLRNILKKYGKSFIFIPILGLLINIGFNDYLLIFMSIYLIYKKKYKYLIVLAPSLVLLLVCIASPVNTYFRYALPYIFALPVNLGLFFKEGVINEK